MKDERTSLSAIERWPHGASGPAARATFYLTAPAPCPYVAGQTERKLFTTVGGPRPGEMAEHLGRLGFRRSQNILYRPACETCRACVPVRIPVAGFAPSASQRRLARAHESISMEARAPRATGEQYALLRGYLADRHPDGGMSEMDAVDYADMVEQTRIDTRVVEYRSRDGKLIAACVTDVQRDGLSMIYSFYAPQHPGRRGLGTWMILDHIARARAAGLDYVYLGFWIAGAPRMAYKARFRPLQGLTPNGWEPVAQP